MSTQPPVVGGLGYRKPLPHERDDRNQRFRAFRLLDAQDAQLVSKPKIWTPGKTVLDQGQTGLCTQFGPDASRTASPNRLESTPLATKQLNYLRAVLRDPWSDNDQDTAFQMGTSVHAAISVLQEDGLIGSYLWIETQDEMDRWLDNYGPVVVGTDWYDRMFNPRPNRGWARLQVEGVVEGGHCYCILGRSKVRGYKMVNSWGPDWAHNGTAYIRTEDFWNTLAQGIEAVGFVDATPAETLSVIS